MTKEQSKTLQIGDRVRYNGLNNSQFKLVDKKHIQEGIIEFYNGTFPVRYENCELVVEDKLVEYLKGRTSLPQLYAQEIRKICREELKFPSLDDFIENNIEGGDIHKYHWFITETQRLNGL